MLLVPDSTLLSLVELSVKSKAFTHSSGGVAFACAFVGAILELA